MTRALADAHSPFELVAEPTDALPTDGLRERAWRFGAETLDETEALKLFLSRSDAPADSAARLLAAKLVGRDLLSSWSSLHTYLRAKLAHAPREEFRSLFLDKKNQLIADELMDQGTVDHAPVYPREVVRGALELHASALILVHNHPSGDPTPSAADVEMTKRVIEAARALDLAVHDHVIVGREGVASLKALGLI